MKGFHKFCVLFVMAAILCPSSRTQSADSTIVILHVARVNYLEEQIFCLDQNRPVLKQINKTKGLTIRDALAMLNKPDIGVAEDCLQAYLFELLLTYQIVQRIQSDFIVNTAARSSEDVESEIKDTMSHPDKASATKRKIHLLVNCQVTRKINDGHSYLLILEVKPIMEGPIGSQSRPVDVEISDPKRPNLAKYHYAASQELYKLCNETIKKLRSLL